MADGKWIPELLADTPVHEAACRALTVRLKVVEHYLPLATEKPHEDVEYVHQLRVGTRRAGAALEIFGGCLSKKRARSVGKLIKRIRRAAGAARDWDVFLLALAEWSVKRPADEQPGLDFLHGHAFRCRAEAQAGLTPLAGTAPDPEKVAEAVRDRAEHGPPPRLYGHALPVLQQQIAELNRCLAAELDDFEHLHALRILGKRLRYAMELFAGCFPTAFRGELYPAVEEMQEILGGINDHRTAQQRLADLRAALAASRIDEWQRLRPGLDRLSQSHRARLPGLRRKFDRWREHWRSRSIPLAQDLLHAPLALRLPESSEPEPPCPPTLPFPEPSNGSATPTASSG